jgi:hypothetical protein
VAGVPWGDHRSKLVDLAIVPMIKIIWSQFKPSSWSGQVAATVAAIIKVLSAADRVRRATPAVDARGIKIQDHHLAMILINRGGCTRGPAGESDA